MYFSISTHTLTTAHNRPRFQLSVLNKVTIAETSVILLKNLSEVDFPKDTIESTHKTDTSNSSLLLGSQSLNTPSSSSSQLLVTKRTRVYFSTLICIKSSFATELV